MMNRLMKYAAVLSIASTLAVAPLYADKEPASMRSLARQLYKDGNYQEALSKFREITLDGSDKNAAELTQDVARAVDCLRKLNQIHEADEYLEAVAQQHGEDWRILGTVAEQFQAIPHYGYMIAGEFRRGHHRGGGRIVHGALRDRVRTLQLYLQAVKLLQQDAAGQPTSAAERMLTQFAYAVLYRGYGSAWRLQLLTDLSELPDFEDGWGMADGGQRGAPVDEQGNPVFYPAPESWEAASNDGQRWRWLLALRTRWQPRLSSRELFDRVEFLHSQFGVQTMAQYDWFGRLSSEGDDSETGAFDLHTLGDHETIARLATGVKRFELPAEHNHILLAQQIRADAQRRNGYRHRATAFLADRFKDRRQYPRAAELLQELLKSGRSQYATAHQQIVGNWGALEPVLTQPAGRGAAVEYRFRNGQEVEFTARSVNISRLLSDVKAYLGKNPSELNWQQLQIQNIGYRLIQEGQKKYVGKQVARWSVELDPRPDHMDRRMTITTPLQKAGAYLLTAKMKDGNEHHVVVWISDTAIVKKPLAGKALYYVADAVSGKPIPNCNVEFFGYWQEHKPPRRYIVHTKNFAERTDQQGMIEIAADEQTRRHQWIATARSDDGRLAFLGFSGIWHADYYDAQYNQVKCMAITDRPVYRPGHEVQFKFWVRHAQYDGPDQSRFANQTFQVEIRNPKNEKVFSESITADAYGGLAGKWELPADAQLGQYSLNVVNHGGGSFRVEEYKKPEYEVTVEAPDEPVMLGETVDATIRAKYYFGSPVVDATVKYKVFRTPYTQTWRPPSPWDWLYGPGYWWFSPSYDWYPGFGRWGCRGPAPWWFWRAPTPPELVAEQETPIGPDGTVQVQIDTALAKQLHDDQDHSYQIQVEVVDASRRSVVANGQVLVARQPYQVFVWTHRGFYRSGETIEVGAAARTLDGKPVAGKGKLRLLRISYEDGQPTEQEAASWQLESNAEGMTALQITAAEPGQYRLAYELNDASGRQVEGGAIITIRGENFSGDEFRFDNIEIIPDQREYAPGESVSLQVSVDKAGAAVLLFLRPSNGVYLPPRVIAMKGKSNVIQFDVQTKDMPNFFVEAVTVHNGRLHSAVREIFVPPVKRVLNVEVTPSSVEYLPGESASAQLKLTDADGKAFIGSVVVGVYDKALDYIAGGSNVPEIKAFFWKWRRSHRPQDETNLGRMEHPLGKPNDPQMQHLGVFGGTVADDEQALDLVKSTVSNELRSSDSRAKYARRELAEAPMAAEQASGAVEEDAAEGGRAGFEPRADAATGEASLVEPAVRQEFADTAFWVAALETNSDGIANIEFEMPENLTAWKVNVWGMGRGTRVGQGSSEVVTRKNLIIRLQAPRFFVETDEVVLSANVHNYLDHAKEVRVRLELDGDSLISTQSMETTVEIEANGEKRVDWRVKAAREGEAVVRMLALTDEESDAMQMEFPVYVHGMLTTESYSGAIRPAESEGGFVFTIPSERRPEQSRLEIRYSPTLAGAMLDALPYLADYPYGCTEQTLNRFLPSVITQQALQQMGVDLAAIYEKRSNLNAQEIGDDRERAEGWKRFDVDPVFDQRELDRRVKAGVNRLTAMQLTDGGWGWFSGWGERSTPHTTAVVVRGLLIAERNDVALVPGVLDRGVQWLQQYQGQELQKLNNWDREAKRPRDKNRPAKSVADNLDALVYMVLAEADKKSEAMRDYLYMDRTRLAVYSLAAYGLGLQRQGEDEKLTMVMRNISQYVREDDENQTAWLELGSNIWWYWYGSEFEAHAFYLKLLAAEDPTGELAPRLVKYLLNNRKHATYWNSTRDTALVVEAFADYLRATGEAKPDLQLEILVDGKVHKQVRVTADNLFSFDNRLVIDGDQLEAGKHTVQFRKSGASPVYFNGYVTNFTLEDSINAAGLEVKVDRRYFKLTRREKSADTVGSRGQALQQRVDAYDRQELVNFEDLKSGDLIEVELTIDSKNDYEYLLIEDKKPAGCEAVEVRSGYNGNEMGAYVEYRDDRVALFARRIARGQHSVSYRLRAEVPGKYSALPAMISAMYAPELKGNSDEFKLHIED